jgi:hypothetical protein
MTEHLHVGILSLLKATAAFGLLATAAIAAGWEEHAAEVVAVLFGLLGLLVTILGWSLRAQWASVHDKLDSIRETMGASIAAMDHRIDELRQPLTTLSGVEARIAEHADAIRGLQRTVEHNSRRLTEVRAVCSIQHKVSFAVAEEPEGS